MIKSPLKYTGNKNRLVKEFYEKHFPKNIDSIVDVFSGGGTIWMNFQGSKIIANDILTNPIKILKLLKKINPKKIAEKIEIITEKYNLSNTFVNGYDIYEKDGNNGLKKINEIGFKELRAYYNSLIDKNTDEAILVLFTLMVYGFNNDMRFNSKGEFNIPIGKTDFNPKTYESIVNYHNEIKEKKVKFTNLDFSKVISKNLEEYDFFYLDPPYLLGVATYNENGGWNEAKEAELINSMKEIDDAGKKFALSNVIQKGDRKNQFIIDAAREKGWNIIKIKYNYINSSYNKLNRYEETQEVLVTNYG